MTLRHATRSLDILLFLLASVVFADDAFTRSAEGGDDPAREAAAGIDVPEIEPIRDLVVIDVLHQAALQEMNLPVVWKGASLILAELTASEQTDLALALPFDVIAYDIRPDRTIYILELEEGEEPPAELAAGILYRKGRQMIVEIPRALADAWSGKGVHGIRVPHTPRGWESRSTLVPFTCTFDATTSDLLSRTTQAEWLDWIEKISGYESVEIGGSLYTIATRNSATMFSGENHARGFDFAVQQVQRWHYGEGGTSIEQDPFTGSGGATWKNLVLTIPGQTSPNEIVMLTGHYDSTSGSPTVTAPGADDNGTGCAMLFEAARLLRQFRFQRTIKLIWFTGEEQGLFGSEAYVADHPTAPILGVVNYDMAGYDSNGDRCMEIHIGTLSQSQDVGNCYRDSIGAYSLGLAHDYLLAGATDRSDHASFWQVNVGAIELAENFFNDGLPGGCVGSDANPAYHTVNDKLPGNVMPSFGFDIGRTALATISAMAVPIEACFAGPPAPAAAPHATSVDLTWPSVPGASTYRIFRSTQGCQGPWTEIATTADTFHTDGGLTENSPYDYYLEAVAPDGFCVSAPSSCVTVVPVGARVAYEPGSAVVLDDSGDHDGFADNCELVTVRANLVNNGSEPLTHVRIHSITSTFAGVQVVTAVPPEIAPGLAIGSSVPVTFKFYLGRSGGSASCGSSPAFNVVVSSDQTPMTTVSFSLSAEWNPAVPLVYSFDADFSGWTGVEGTWNRIAGGAPGSTPFSLRTPNVNNACAAIQSPVFFPTSQSTMTMWVNYGIDGTLTDRAVVRAINQFTQAKTLLVPTGAAYTTTGPGPAGCDGVGALQGWAGSATTWQAANFSLGAFAGIPIKVEVRYISDATGLGSQGFWFDAVQVTNPQSCDTQSNACAPLPAEVSPGGAAVPFTLDKGGSGYELRFSEVAGATGYNVYGGTLASLHGGLYDHAAGGGLCALTDGATGDGQVLASVAAGAFPDNSYLLAVAKNAAGESIYGHRSTGATIPLALSSCP
jgi:hypothetical protein